MLTYIKRYIALLLLCGILTQCFYLVNPDKLPPETLPPITQEGKHTFGCYVNGNLFIPRKPTTFTPSLESRYNLNNTLSINVVGSKDSLGIKISESMGLFFLNITREGVYRLGSYPDICDVCDTVSNDSPVYYLKRNGDYFCYFNHPNHNIEGTLNITKINKVLDNYFISGTFEFTLTMRKPGQCDISVLKVTQGRFDIKLL